MEQIGHLKRALKDAQGFLICTGAGMSADSGIPVYRTYTKYPSIGWIKSPLGLERSNHQYGYEGWGPNDLDIPGLDNMDIHDFGRSNLFEKSITWNSEGSTFNICKKGLLLWKYFFDQRQKFTTSIPHTGYMDLNKIIKHRDYFVITSNVDSFHLRGGFSKSNVIECHGSLLNENVDFRIQCSQGSLCNSSVWTFNFDPIIQSSRDIQEENLPRCPKCKLIARPNYLSFNDDNCLVNVFTFDSDSRKRMITWLDNVQKDLIIIFEIGVGEVVSTIKNRSRKTWKECPNSILIRINPAPDPQPLSERYYNLPMTCQSAMTMLLNMLNN